VGGRPAVQTGQRLHIDKRNAPRGKESQSILFGQKG